MARLPRPVDGLVASGVLVFGILVAFTAAVISSRVLCSRMIPTRWMTVSHPPISASRVVGGSRMSPSTRSMASNP